MLLLRAFSFHCSSTLAAAQALRTVPVRAPGNCHLVLQKTHVFEHHRLARDAGSVDECALLVDYVNDSNEPVLEGSDADVGDAADLDEIVKDTDSHFYLYF